MNLKTQFKAIYINIIFLTPYNMTICPKDILILISFYIDNNINTLSREFCVHSSPRISETMLR